MAKFKFEDMVKKLKVDLEEIIVKPYDKRDHGETPPIGHFLAGMYAGISGLVVKDDATAKTLQFNQAAVLVALQQIAEDHGAHISVVPDIRAN